MEWDAHTLKVLELDYVRGEWARRAETPAGREHDQWGMFGTADAESADYRACATYGALYQ